MDKEQYDIVKEAMDIHAENIAIAFYMWNKSDVSWEDRIHLVKELFQQFKQEICKKEK